MANLIKSMLIRVVLDVINQSYSKDKKIEICQTKYLNNMTEQDHRFIQKELKLTLGFRSLYGAGQTIKGIEILHMIKK